MGRYDGIDPQDIDPETGKPYAGYSSPSLDTSFHDHEMAGEEDEVPERVQWWLEEGNAKADLVAMYWAKLSKEEQAALVKEIDDACNEEGTDDSNDS